MADPILQFDKLHAEAEVLFLVYYRGHWCPFCQSYLRQLQALTTSASNSKNGGGGGGFAAQHAVAVAVTAEPESALAATRAATGYTGATIVDPEHRLAAELKRRGWLDVAISDKNGYAHGMAQPAVLVVRRSGEVLFSWAIVPGLMNFGGAKDRPNLNEVWENIEAQLNGKPPVHAKPSSVGAMAVLWKKVFG